MLFVDQVEFADYGQGFALALVGADDADDCKDGNNSPDNQANYSGNSTAAGSIAKGIA